MPGELTLLAIALLPLMAGLLVAGFAPRWRRWFGAERALMVAFRIALGGTLLAALLLGTAATAEAIICTYAQVPASRLTSSPRSAVSGRLASSTASPPTSATSA